MKFEGVTMVSRTMLRIAGDFRFRRGRALFIKEYKGEQYVNIIVFAGCSGTKICVVDLPVEPKPHRCYCILKPRYHRLLDRNPR